MECVSCGWPADQHHCLRQQQHCSQARHTDRADWLSLSCVWTVTLLDMLYFLNAAYMIQPAVTPVVQPIWQPAVSCKQTSNGLTTVLNQQPLFVQPVVKPGCTSGLTNTVQQPCWTNSCSFNQLSNWVVQPVWQLLVYTIQPVVKPTTGFDNQLNVCIHDTTGCMVYTNIQPVVKPDWQQVVSCKRVLYVHITNAIRLTDITDGALHWHRLLMRSYTDRHHRWRITLTQMRSYICSRSCSIFPFSFFTRT